MLSPGDFHKFVPSDPIQNVQFRVKLLDRCKGDRPFQKAVVEMCRQDILFWINCFCWTHNPRKVGREVGPFITWDFQNEVILDTLRQTHESDEDYLWEKSREMGATWMALILCDWGCLFHAWKKYLFISHSEQAVDRPGDSSCLFWKIQFIHSHLPDWMTRGAFKRKLGFEFPHTKSSINGAANSERAGVGGRETVAVLDEFSKHPAADEIWGQTADTGPRLVIGTHYGVGSKFHNLTLKPDIKKQVMHWTQHPDKRKGLYKAGVGKLGFEIIDKDYDFPPDFEFVRVQEPTGGPFPGIRSPWYDRQVRRRENKRDVAMHLDIDAQGSQSQFFEANLIRELVAQHQDPWWEGNLDYDPITGKSRLGLMPQKGGLLKLWLNFKDGKIPDGKYVFGGDISYGTGATPSCFSGADARTGKKIAELSTAHMSPQDLAPLVTALCWLFQDFYGQPAYLVWETPGPGIQFGQAVLDLGYTNIFYRYSDPELDGGKRSDKPGWHSSPKTKEKLLAEYRAALFSKKFVNPSEEALRQCGPYRKMASGKGVEHPHDQGADDPDKARQNHGDLVIADALCWMLCRDLDVMDEEKQVVQDGPPIGSLAWRRELRKSEEEWYSYE